MAVLPARKAHRGLRRAGQGIHSLQAALLDAGALSAITSLSKVDDGTTLDLFEVFYRAHWVEGLGKAEALRRAQRTLHEAGHPLRDWAGWVLTGDAA